MTHCHPQRRYNITNISNIIEILHDSHVWVHHFGNERVNNIIKHNSNHVDVRRLFPANHRPNSLHATRKLNISVNSIRFLLLPFSIKSSVGSTSCAIVAVTHKPTNLCDDFITFLILAIRIRVLYSQFFGYSMPKLFIFKLLFIWALHCCKYCIYVCFGSSKPYCRCRSASARLRVSFKKQLTQIPRECIGRPTVSK